MNKNKKVNPLTHFNNLKAAAVKRGNIQLANYKKSLRKAQPGIQTGPITEAEAFTAAITGPQKDPMAYGQGPRLNPPTRAERMDELIKQGARASAIDNATKANLATEQYKSGLSNAALIKQGLLDKQVQKENAFKQSQIIDSAMKSQRKKGGSVKRKRK